MLQWEIRLEVQWEAGIGNNRVEKDGSMVYNRVELEFRNNYG